MSHYNQSPGGARFDGLWEKLSNVAVKGAEYNSRERQPHPKCLEGTRENLLGHIYGLLDDEQGNQIVWLNGTAGVGKSAVAFTVADRMRDLKVTEERLDEKRLAGTFFFSRKYASRCTTEYFFATLAYQLAINFPSLQGDISEAIWKNPSLLHPDKCLRDQMEALFLRPLRRLQPRLVPLAKCPPLVFVVDALDECTSEDDIIDLISLLGKALRDPGIPVTHILLTSRSEAHIREAIDEKDTRPLVCEIPVKISGKDVTSLISLDGADVDDDINIFLRHSLSKLRNRYPNFPEPTEHELEQLASRAGRRFIVASTMVKFIIDDGYSDPCVRLQLMLKLTSTLLPGTEVYKLYDHIISTCSNPFRAYLHLSVVAALANPLPISQIIALLGPVEGRDVETMLVQLRSVMDIPTDSGSPVNIYHSSVRDYVLEPTNCSLFKEQSITSPHSLLAYSSFLMMVQCIPKSTSLLDALLELRKQSQAMKSDAPQSLRQTLAFIVEPPTALGIFTTLLWLRGDRNSRLQFWLETQDGRAWLHTQEGKDWLVTGGGLQWLKSQFGLDWLQTQDGKYWLQTPDMRDWVQSSEGLAWLQTQGGKDWLWTRGGREWLQSSSGRDWLQSLSGRAWLQSSSGLDWLQSPSGRDWLQSPSGWNWLQSPDGRDWLQSLSGSDWLRSSSGWDWLQSQSQDDRMHWESVDSNNQHNSMQDWSMQIDADVLDRQHQVANSERRDWLNIFSGQRWSQTSSGEEWLQYPTGDWLQTSEGRDWLQLLGGRQWLQAQGRREWLQTQSGREWLQTQTGREWLHTEGGREWLQTAHGQAWQSTPAASFWVDMEEFLKTVEAIKEFMAIPELSSLPVFEAIQQFKSLPDFLMYPAFLTLTAQSPISASAENSDVEIICVFTAFVNGMNEAQERSRSNSDALKYACQNWAMHLSRVSNPWDDKLNHIFKFFWNHHLLSWLERQWCLRGLRSCLVILSEGQKLAKEWDGPTSLFNCLSPPRDHIFTPVNVFLCLILIYIAHIFSAT